MAKTKSSDCCLCGLPYEQIGNNPEPLSETGRCCDACDEVVIQARIDPGTVLRDIERVEQAMARVPNDGRHSMARAAVCALRGPALLAEKQRLMATLHDQLQAKG